MLKKLLVCVVAIFMVCSCVITASAADNTVNLIDKNNLVLTNGTSNEAVIKDNGTVLAYNDGDNTMVQFVNKTKIEKGEHVIITAKVKGDAYTNGCIAMTIDTSCEVHTQKNWNECFPGITTWGELWAGNPANAGKYMVLLPETVAENEWKNIDPKADWTKEVTLTMEIFADGTFKFYYNEVDVTPEVNTYADWNGGYPSVSFNGASGTVNAFTLTYVEDANSGDNSSDDNPSTVDVFVPVAVALVGSVATITLIKKKRTNR